MHIQMTGMRKRFGDTLAVDGVDFEARPGRVSALLGENGAGKSTLMKLLYGVHRPDGGEIVLDGKPAMLNSPQDAMRLAIGMVFQQFSLIPALTVRENLALVSPQAPFWTGRGARRLSALEQHVLDVVPEVDVDSRVSDLSVGQKQLVELAKVLLLKARCVILDEPSAVLAPPEAQRLWALVRKLVARGLSVVLITHKIKDVQACADEVYVMRGGRLAGHGQAAGLSDAAVVEMMVGQVPQAVANHPPVPAAARVRLWVKGVDAGNARGIDLQVRTGEIVGVAGVSGNGQTALAEAVAGMLPLTAGEVILDGELIRAPRLQPRIDQRLGYIPEQPMVNGVAPELSLALNLALKNIGTLPFLPDRGAMAGRAAEVLKRFDVRPANPQAQANWLSGGNLQKLVAARELSEAPAAVVACYPTMGLDVAASAQIYEVLFGLARQGSAVLWFSEDLDDLLKHAHRVVVMLDGRIVQALDASRTSAMQLGAWMTGTAPDAGPEPTTARVQMPAQVETA